MFAAASESTRNTAPYAFASCAFMHRTNSFKSVINLELGLSISQRPLELALQFTLSNKPVTSQISLRLAPRAAVLRCTFSRSIRHTRLFFYKYQLDSETVLNKN